VPDRSNIFPALFHAMNGHSNTHAHNQLFASETGSETSAHSIMNASSTATLCHLDDMIPEENRAHASSSRLTVVEEGSAIPGRYVIRSPVSAATEQAEPVPPPPPPDIVAVMDPASIGGGGPLKRITTQQRERQEAEARERAEREAHRGASTNGETTQRSGVLSRFLPISTSKRRQLKLSTPTSLVHHSHPEDPDEHKHLPGSALLKHRPSSLSVHHDTPTTEKVLDLEQGLPSTELQPDNTLPPIEEHVYPDGGYGWVVLGACVTLSSLIGGYVPTHMANEKRSLGSLAGACAGVFSKM
jgi:hypothetical protein